MIPQTSPNVKFQGRVAPRGVSLLPPKMINRKNLRGDHTEPGGMWGPVPDIRFRARSIPSINCRRRRDSGRRPPTDPDRPPVSTENVEKRYSSPGDLDRLPRPCGREDAGAGHHAGHRHRLRPVLGVEALDDDGHPGRPGHRLFSHPEHLGQGGVDLRPGHLGRRRPGWR